MKDNQIERINFLAKKAKEVGLEPHELVEQKALRKEYVESYKDSLKAHLNSITVVEQDGTRHRLRKKTD